MIMPRQTPKGVTGYRGSAEPWPSTLHWGMRENALHPFTQWDSSHDSGLRERKGHLSRLELEYHCFLSNGVRVSLILSQQI